MGRRLLAIGTTVAVLLGAAPSGLHAQDPAPRPTQDPAPRQIHELPFRTAGGLGGQILVVEGQVDGRSAYLLFDTGASYPLILDAAVAKRWGYAGTVSLPVAGVGTGSLTLTRVGDMALGGHRTGELPAGIMDLGRIRLVMGLTGARVDGIVGMPVIGRFRSVRIDFGARVVRCEERGPGDPPADADVARELARDLAAVRAIGAGKGGALGIEGEPAMAGDARGVRLTAVTPGSVAARAGLRVGDVCTHLHGEALDGGPRDLVIPLATAGPGAPVHLRVCRGDATLEIQCATGTWPAGAPAPRGGEGF